MRTVIADVLRAGRFRPAAPSQRFAYACAALLVGSGLLHLGVYAVDGGPWEGPVSWRKPVVFGLSFGITLATLAWITTFLRPGRVAGWLLLGPLGLASLVEVGLITMQRWRGVASHFNETTTFDEAVFSAMGLMVLVVGAITVVLAVWSWVRVDAPPSLALAIRLGLLLTLVSNGVGVQMIAEGGNTFGAAGALKVPHAVALHALQVLPALALVLVAGHYAETRRLRVLELAAAGYVVLIGSTMVQTYAGQSPLDPGPLPLALAAVGLLLLAAGAVIALRGLASAGRVVGHGVHPGTP